MNDVFIEADQLHSAFEVFEKKCRLYRALLDLAVSENLRVTVVYKNVQDAELRKHLLRSAATPDSFMRPSSTRSSWPWSTTQ